MDRHFELLKITRENCLRLAEGLTNEQLNKIPENFNNNIAWNLGHIVATQQLLCYALSGNETRVSADFINKYRKGSKPEGNISDEEIQFIKEQMFSLISQTKEDLAKGTFKTFKTYPTSFGVTLGSIEDAIQFNNMHESMHLGSIIALKKLV